MSRIERSNLEAILAPYRKLGYEIKTYTEYAVIEMPFEASPLVANHLTLKELGVLLETPARSTFIPFQYYVDNNLVTVQPRELIWRIELIPQFYSIYYRFMNYVKIVPYGNSNSEISIEPGLG